MAPRYTGTDKTAGVFDKRPDLPVSDGRGADPDRDAGVPFLRSCHRGGSILPSSGEEAGKGVFTSRSADAVPLWERKGTETAGLHPAGQCLEIFGARRYRFFILGETGKNICLSVRQQWPYPKNNFHIYSTAFTVPTSPVIAALADMVLGFPLQKRLFPPIRGRLPLRHRTAVPCV